MIFHIKNFLVRVRIQKLCPFYKFQRDFANKVEIHISKFSQQLDHISHGKLIIFYFFDISIIFFYFFKLKRRSMGGGVFSTRVTNGARWVWCAITMSTSNGALSPGAPLLTKCTPPGPPFQLKK